MTERVVILNDFSTVRGGATSRAVALAAGLARTGTEVVYFTGDHGADLDLPGVEVVAADRQSLTERSKLDAVTRGMHDPLIARQLSRFIAETDTPRTIYHLHGWSLVLTPAVFAALRPVLDRIVLHAHDFSLACPNVVYFNFSTSEVCQKRPLSGGCLATNCDKRSYAQKLWRSGRHAVQRHHVRDIRSSAPIIAVHEDMEPLLQRGGFHGPLIAIRNPATPFLDTPIAAEANSDLIYVGQLLNFKGVFDLADAAAKAKVHVAVVGEGSDRAEMERRLPQAEYTGWLKGAALHDRLKRARAVVVPTRGIEPFGLVPVEAAASGLPVIISDSAFLAKEIVAKGMGLSYPAGDTDALAGLLRQIASDDTLVARLSRNAAKHGAELAPTEDEWFSRIRDVYRQRLAGLPGHSRVDPGTDDGCPIKRASNEVSL